MITGYGEVSDAVALMKSGALDYLTKPFDINDFLAMVERHLSHVADTRITLDEAGENDRFKPGSGHAV